MSIKQRLKATTQSVLSSSSETLSASQQFQNARSGNFSLKASEFISDILDDTKNTPHDEMRDTYRMISNDIQVSQSLTKKALLVMGRQLTVESDDDETIEHFEQEVIPEFRQPFLVAARNALGAGNGHVEVKRGEQTGVPMGFEEMSRPHKVYNVYAEDSMDVVGYIQESFRSNTGQKFQVLVSDRNKRTVRGQPFEKDDIIHLRVGSSAMPGYGRSDFQSGLDDYKISREMKRSQGIIARHKMNPRKAFVFNEDSDNGGGIDEPGDTSQDTIRRERENKLSNLGEEENPVYHDLELDVIDYSYDPNIGENQEVLEKLSRDLTSPVPQFLTHASDSNRSTSRESMNVTQMELASIRERWRSQIDPIFQEIAEAHGLDEDVSVKFGEFNFPTRDEKTTETLQMWTSGVLTLGQTVNRLPFEVEVKEEFEDKYEFELDRNTNPLESIQKQVDQEN